MKRNYRNAREAGECIRFVVGDQALTNSNIGVCTFDRDGGGSGDGSGASVGVRIRAYVSVSVAVAVAVAVVTNRKRSLVVVRPPEMKDPILCFFESNDRA